MRIIPRLIRLFWSTFYYLAYLPRDLYWRWYRDRCTTKHPCSDCAATTQVRSLGSTSYREPDHMGDGHHE